VQERTWRSENGLPCRNQKIKRGGRRKQTGNEVFSSDLHLKALDKGGGEVAVPGSPEESLVERRDRWFKRGKKIELKKRDYTDGGEEGEFAKGPGKAERAKPEEGKGEHVTSGGGKSV